MKTASKQGFTYINLAGFGLVIICNLEKYFIICENHEASLNQKCGVMNSCRHMYVNSSFPTTQHDYQQDSGHSVLRFQYYNCTDFIYVCEMIL